MLLRNIFYCFVVYFLADIVNNILKSVTCTNYYQLLIDIYHFIIFLFLFTIDFPFFLTTNGITYCALLSDWKVIHSNSIVLVFTLNILTHILDRQRLKLNNFLSSFRSSIVTACSDLHKYLSAFCCPILFLSHCFPFSNSSSLRNDVKWVNYLFSIRKYFYPHFYVLVTQV